MEVISDYEIPTSWESKGMDWNAPDPRNADYLMAIREAIIERCAALHLLADGRIYEISPFKIVSYDVVKGVVKSILMLADGFVNLGWDKYKEDYSDFPRMWTYADLVNERGCEMSRFSSRGSICERGGAWLKSIRNALDRLTVIRANTVYGKSLSRSGNMHDPPFDESIGTALEMAMSELGTKPINRSFPSWICAWSGNTHWKCPDPNYEGEHPERDNVDGYCGYAESAAYRLTAARSWLKGAEFDIFAAVVASRPTDPVPYSVQLDTSIFDSAESGFKEGLNWTERVHVKDPYDFEFTLGDADAIPRNEVVPVSEFDEEGYVIRRHSAKRGWVGTAYGFLDYGVEGGFRFRSKES